MDFNYETLESLMQSKEAIYAAGTAVFAGVAGILGYIAGRSGSKYALKKAEIKKEENLARVEAEKAQYEVERQKALASVELSRLKYQNADAEHKRSLEIRAKEREWQLEDGEREHKRELEAYERRKEEEKLKQNNRIAAATQLCELKGDLQNYLDDCRKSQTASAVNPDYMEKREAYREELVDKLIKNLEDGDGLFDEYTSISDDDKEKIKDLVDLKFPLPEIKAPEMPAHLQKLIDIVVDEE